MEEGFFRSVQNGELKDPMVKTRSTEGGSMQTRNFASISGVPVVGFGGGAISGEGGGYGFGSMDEASACKVLEHAFEAGIRLFDTAPIYGKGVSEKRIGIALSRNKAVREKMVLVSKLGVTWNDEGTYVSNSPDVCWRMLETSLKDLQTDYLDSYLIHWPDPKTPIEATMEALVKMKQQGLVRSIGACNFSVEQMEQAQKIAPLQVLQCNFALFDNSCASQILPYCEKRGISFMSYGTLAKGLLAGTAKKGRAYDTFDYRSNVPAFQTRVQTLEREVNEFENIAKELHLTPSQLAVAWVLSHKAVSVALCGSKSAAQIDDVVEGGNVQIPTEVLARLAKLSDVATKIFLQAAK